MGYVGRRRARDEQGFSLVELLVIVVIIGILAGIAITTYISQARKADRSAAISTLSNMRLAAESIRADQGEELFSSYPRFYDEQQQSYTYVGRHEPSTGANIVSVGGPNAGVLPDGDPDDFLGGWVTFAVKGRDECYYLSLETGKQVIYQHTAPVVNDDDCTASEFAPSDIGSGSWG